MKRILAVLLALSMLMACALAEVTEETTGEPLETPVSAETPLQTEETPETPVPPLAEEADTSIPPSAEEADTSIPPPLEDEALPEVIPADAEAWMADPEDSERVLFGKLEHLIKDFTEDTEATVYIRADKLLKIKDKSLNDLKKAAFLPDESVFEAKKFVVKASASAPEGVEAPPEGEIWLYVWVERKATATPPPKEPEELDIFVEAANYLPATWSNLKPSFALSGIPEGEEGYSYAAIAYDERFIPLSAGAFTASDEGSYEVRFAILDRLGDVVALSAKYQLKLDFTPPAYVSAALEAEGKAIFHVSSADPMSGLNAYSVDGGKTWVPVDEDAVYTHTGKLGEIYAPGMIRARDNAGNIAEYPGEFAIPKPMPNPGGGGGGGGGGGSGTPSIKHTGDEDVDTTPYDALDLVLPEEPMEVLTVGGQELELTLKLDSAENLEALEAPTFTASLIRWDGGDAAPDTLVLDAVPDAALVGEYTYLWQFNGAVYRMLLNSGVDYLVLRVGDHVTALSTAGFTAGAEYTRLKAGGTSTRKFNYSIWMAGSTLDPLSGGNVVEADVEGEVYPLTGDTEQAMYHYDLYYGPAELLQAPFGAWQPEEEAS